MTNRERLVRYMRSIRNLAEMLEALATVYSFAAQGYAQRQRYLHAHVRAWDDCA